MKPPARPWLVGSVLLSLCACGGGTKESPAGDAGQVLSRPPAEALVFTAGGSADDILLTACGTVRRLQNRAGLVAGDVAPPGLYLAAWSNSERSLERFVGRSESGPVFVEQGKAWNLPGWPPGASARSAAFSPDGNLLAVAPEGIVPGTGVMLWKIPLAPLPSIPKAGGGIVDRILWSDDGRTLMTVDEENRVSIHRPPGSKPVYTDDLDPAVDGFITAADLSPDGDWFVVAANAIRVRAWKLPFMHTELKPWGRVREVFFAGEAGTVVTVDETSAAIRWRINYGNVVADTSRTLGPGLMAIGVPSGGRYFFAADSSGRLHGWGTDLEPLAGSPVPACGP